jgi:hypothetical protein
LVDWSQMMSLLVNRLPDVYGSAVNGNDFSPEGIANAICDGLSEEECVELVTRYGTNELYLLAEALFADIVATMSAYIAETLGVFARRCGATRVVIAQDCPRSLNRKIANDVGYKPVSNHIRKITRECGGRKRYYYNMRKFVPFISNVLASRH